MRAYSYSWFVLAAWAAAAPRLSGQGYTAEFLRELHSGQGTTPAAVNDTGRAVGRSRNFLGFEFAALWQNGGGTLLADFGPHQAAATGVNDSGRAVGYALDVHGRRRAVYWDAIDVIEDIGDLGGGYAQANAVDDAGNIVGFSATLPGGLEYRAFRWDAASGQMTDLGALTPGWESQAAAIGAGGLIGGDSRPPGGRPRAVVWTAPQALVDLGAGFEDSTVTGVNAGGTAAGWGRNGAGVTSFTWTAGGGRVDLPNPPGALAVFVHAINDAGELAAEVAGRAYLYRAGAWLDLELLVAPFSVPRLFRAVDIADGGIVLCESTDLRAPRAVLLHPAPSGLALGAADPGQAGTDNRIGVAGATPGARVYLGYGLNPGFTRVLTCPGLGLNIENARLAEAAFADADGRAVFARFVPATGAGRTLLVQAVEPSTCRVSNRTEQVF